MGAEIRSGHKAIEEVERCLFVVLVVRHWLFCF
jgi:hypothetical protein